MQALQLYKEPTLLFEQMNDAPAAAFAHRVRCERTPPRRRRPARSSRTRCRTENAGCRRKRTIAASADNAIASMKEHRNMATITGYHHMSLSVTDLGRSTKWYQEVLGFEVTAEIEGAGFRRIRLRAPESGVTLTLTAHDNELEGAFDENRPGLDHVAFEVADSDVMNCLKERFDQLGVVHSDVKTSDSGSALITLRDPDNIQLEVFVGHFAPTVASGGPA